MKVQKDMIVGLDEKAFKSYQGYRTSKHLKNFLFICTHDAGDGYSDEVEVKVFSHKTFQQTLNGVKQRYKKNELKGTKYKFKTKMLV